jgi:hypothetical protein
MNPKHLSVRMDPKTGDLWLTEERFRKPIKKVANITAPVLLALSAELTSVDNSQSLTRDVRFSDGTAIRITAEMIQEDPNVDEAPHGDTHTRDA